MSLHFYRNNPFISSTQLSPTDTFTGDGNTTSFNLVNNPGTQIGSTVQADGLEYLRYNNGFVISGNSITLSSAPPANAQIVVPGINQLVMSAFDVASVPGLTNPEVQQIPCYLVDPVDISTYQYAALPGASGIQVSFVNLITSAGANTTWVQLAPADPVTGLPMTFGNPGQPLYLPNIMAFNSLACAISINASSCQVYSKTGFLPQAFLLIDSGNNNQELVQILSIGPSTPPGNGYVLGTTGFQFTHSIGTKLFLCGWPFWVQLTVPLGASAGIGTNLYNLGLQRIGIREQRP